MGGLMAVVLEQFVRSLEESGLMSGEEIQAFLDELPPKEKPQSGGDFAKLLYRSHRLTKFQAEAVYRGKHKGLILGDYVVLDRIGAGGMGEVYRARHERMKRTVAVKVLPTAVTKSVDAVQRFQREVEAAAKLIHPNVVTAFDAGEAAGLHFLVMEYVEGEDLAALIKRRGPFDVAGAVDCILQAARGLQYAHDEGVVHRDIKPSNLLLDKKGTIKILDMGLARFVSDVTGDESTAAALTQSGQVMGTVDYMSPEQAENTRRADKPADIYSLGATLFYLLTGRPMYAGDTLIEKIVAHRDQPVPSLRTSRNEVSRPMDDTFRAMVAKKPSMRQRSMAQLIEELERCAPAGAVGHSPVQAATGREESAETVDFTGKTQQHPDAAPTLHTAPTTAMPPSPRPAAKPHAAAPKRSKKRQSQWDDAVKDADRDYRRRHNIGWFNKLRTWSKKTTGYVITLVILIVVVGVLFVGGRHVWQSYSLRRQCYTRILESVDPMVKKEKFEPITSLRLTNAPALQAVPDEVTFEANLSALTNTGLRPVGKLTGKMQRSTGRVVYTVDRAAGKDLRNVQASVKPIP